jgi:hypothetical protein
LVPALLVNPTTLNYTDVDGDQVTVRVIGHGSAPQLSLDEFIFVPAGTGEQLQQIDLSNDPAGFSGSDLEIDVVANGGDGLASVGYINAVGVDLGSVTVPGDLGRIDAGSGDSITPALQQLVVHSLGQMGVTTQVSGGNLDSNIGGAVGEIHVDTDIAGAVMHVSAPSTDDGGPEVAVRSSSNPVPLISRIVVVGSIIGQDDFNSGLISCDGDIGSVEIGGNLQGGAGVYSGRIDCGGEVDQAHIAGSILGGTGAASGSIHAHQINQLTVDGSIVAGSGSRSAGIETNVMRDVTIAGNVTGTRENPVRIAAFSQFRTEVRTIERRVPEIVTVMVYRHDGTCVEVQEKITVTVHMQITVVVEDRGRVDNLSVHGNVAFAEITAGTDGQIGTVNVGGDWMASSLAAGVTAGDDGQLGTDDDFLFVQAKDPSAARIGSLTIGGRVLGTSNPDDHFGIVARQIDAFFAGGASKVHLHAGPGNDNYLLASTGIRLREVPALAGRGGQEP